MKIVSHFRKNVYLIGLLLSVLLSSCAAVQVAPAAAKVQQAVSPIGAQTVMDGLRLVLREAPGTVIYQQGELVLLGWPKGSSYGYLFLGKGQVDLTGVRENVFNFQSMIRHLESGGWKPISVSQLPPKVFDVIAAYTVEAALAAASRMTTIWVIPAVLISPDGSMEEFYMPYMLEPEEL